MGRSRRVVGVVMAIAAACALLAACSSVPGAPLASVGATSNRQVPGRILDTALTNQHDQPVDLASWRHKTIVLVPFLALCSDICPMTTGIMYQVERSVKADGAAKTVEIVELSVDPKRDTPTRLAAYAKLTGATWQLVTEAPANLKAISKFFGFYYERVPEGTPPSIDWMTGKPLTYDIDHSDGFIIIDPHGTERFITDAAPDFTGKLDPTLNKFLSPLGRKHLKDAPSPNYTGTDVLQALGWSMGRNLPVAG